jgi:hypothetical protein
MARERATALAAGSPLLLLLAAVLVLALVVPAAARVCSGCMWGYCDTLVSTTSCASCFPFYRGPNCDLCATGAVATTLNGTDLTFTAGAFNNTVAGCFAACAALSNYTVYAGITNGNVCTCGNSYGRYGLSSNVGDCVACVDNGALRCGGVGTVSVYYRFTGEYKGCYNDLGNATMCVDDMSTAAPDFNTDFTMASKILYGLFIAVCVVGGVYFVGLIFYCVYRRNRDRNSKAHARASRDSGGYFF